MRGTTFVILCCTLQYATANIDIDLTDPENIGHTKGAHQTFLNASKRIVKTGDGYEEIETIQSRIDFDQVPQSVLLHHGKHPEKRRIVFVWGKDSRGNDVLYEEEETITKLSDDELPIASGSSSTSAIVSSSSSGSGTGSAAAELGTGGYSEGEKSDYNGRGERYGSVPGTSTVAVTAKATAKAQAKASGKKGKSENYGQDNHHGSATTTATAVTPAEVTGSGKGEQSDCHGPDGQHEFAAGTNAAVANAAAAATGYGIYGKSHYNRPAGRHGSAAGTSAATAGRPGQYEYYGKDSVTASAKGQTKSAYTEKRIRKHRHGSSHSSSSPASVRTSEIVSEKFSHGQRSGNTGTAAAAAVAAASVNTARNANLDGNAGLLGLEKPFGQVRQNGDDIFDEKSSQSSRFGSGAGSTAAKVAAAATAKGYIKGQKSDHYGQGGRHGTAADTSAVAVAAAAVAAAAGSGEGEKLDYSETPGQDVSAEGTAAVAAAVVAASGPKQSKHIDQDTNAASDIYREESLSSSEERYAHGRTTTGLYDYNLHSSAETAATIATAAVMATEGAVKGGKSDHYRQGARHGSAADTSAVAEAVAAAATATGSGEGGSVVLSETGAYNRYADIYGEESLSSSEERFAHGRTATGLNDYNLHGSAATAATATAAVATEGSDNGGKSDHYGQGARHGSATAAAAAAAAVANKGSVKGGKSDHYEHGARQSSAADRSPVVVAAAAAAAAAGSGEGGSVAASKTGAYNHYADIYGEESLSSSEERFAYGRTVTGLYDYKLHGSAKTAAAVATEESVKGGKTDHHGQGDRHGSVADTSAVAVAAAAVAAAAGSGEGEKLDYSETPGQDVSAEGTAAVAAAVVAASGPKQSEHIDQDSNAASDIHREESLSSSEERYAHGHTTTGLYDYNLHSSAETAARIATAAVVATEEAVKGGKSDHYGQGARHGSAADTSAVAEAVAAAATATGSGEGGSVVLSETGAYNRYADIYGEESLSSSEERFAHGRTATGLNDYNLHGSAATAATAAAAVATKGSDNGGKSDHYGQGARHGSATAAAAAAAAVANKGSVKGGKSDHYEHGARQSSAADRSPVVVAAAAAAAAAAAGSGEGGSVAASKSGAYNHYADIYGEESLSSSEERFAYGRTVTGLYDYKLHGSAATAAVAAAEGSVKGGKSDHYGQRAQHGSAAKAAAAEVAIEGSVKGGKSDHYGLGARHSSAATAATVATKGSVKGSKSDHYEQGARHGSAADTSAVAVATVTAAAATGSGEGDSVAASETGAYIRYSDIYGEESSSSSEERFAYGRTVTGLYDYKLHGSAVTAEAVATEGSVKGGKSDHYGQGDRHGSAADTSAIAVAAAAAAAAVGSGEGGSFVLSETGAYNRYADIYGEESLSSLEERFAHGRTATGLNDYNLHGSAATAATAAAAVATEGSVNGGKSDHYGQGARHGSATAAAAAAAAVANKGSVKGGKSDHYEHGARQSSAADRSPVVVAAAAAAAAAAGSGEGGSVAASKSGAYNHYADIYGEESLSSSEERFAYGRTVTGLYDYKLHGSAATAAVAAAEGSVKGGKSDHYGQRAQHGSAAKAAAAEVAIEGSVKGGKSDHYGLGARHSSAATAATVATEGSVKGSKSDHYEQGARHGSAADTSAVAVATVTAAAATGSGEGDSVAASETGAYIRYSDIYGEESSSSSEERFAYGRTVTGLYDYKLHGSAVTAEAVATEGSVKGGKSDHYGQGDRHGSAADTSAVAVAAAAAAAAVGSGEGGSVVLSETGAYNRYADIYGEESLSSLEERFAHGRTATGLNDYNLHGSAATAATAAAAVATKGSVNGGKSDHYGQGARHGSATAVAAAVANEGSVKGGKSDHYEHGVRQSSAADRSPVVVAAAAAAAAAGSGEGGSVAASKTGAYNRYADIYGEESLSSSEERFAYGRTVTGLYDYKLHGSAVTAAAVATEGSVKGGKTDHHGQGDRHGSAADTSAVAAAAAAAAAVAGSGEGGSVAASKTGAYNRYVDIYGAESLSSSEERLAYSPTATGLYDYKLHGSAATAATVATAAAVATKGSNNGAMLDYYEQGAPHGSAADTSAVAVAAVGVAAAAGSGEGDSDAASKTGAYNRYADIYGEESSSSSEERFAYGRTVTGLYDYKLHGSAVTAEAVATEGSVKGGKSDHYGQGDRHSSAADTSAVAVAAAAAAAAVGSGEGGSVVLSETGAYNRYADIYDEESLSSSEERFAHGRTATGLNDYNLHGSAATAATAAAAVATEGSVNGGKLDHCGQGDRHGSAADTSAVAVAAAAAAAAVGSGEGGSVVLSETGAYNRYADIYGEESLSSSEERFSYGRTATRLDDYKWHGSAATAAVAAAEGSVKGGKSDHYGQRAQHGSAATAATVATEGSVKVSKSDHYEQGARHGSAADTSAVAVAAVTAAAATGSGEGDSVAASETGAYIRYADIYGEESLSSSEERFVHGRTATGRYDYNLRGSAATAAAVMATEGSVKGGKSDHYGQGARHSSAATAAAATVVATEGFVKGGKSDYREQGARHGSVADTNAVAVAAAGAAAAAGSGEGGSVAASETGEYNHYADTYGEESLSSSEERFAYGRTATGLYNYNLHGSAATAATVATAAAVETEGSVKGGKSDYYGQGARHGSVADTSYAGVLGSYEQFGPFGQYGDDIPDEEFRSGSDSGSVAAKALAAAAARGYIKVRKSDHYGQGGRYGTVAGTSTAASTAAAVATDSGKGGKLVYFGTPSRDVSAAGTAAAAAVGVAASGPKQIEHYGLDYVAASATGQTKSAPSTKIRILEHGHGSSRSSSSTSKATSSETVSQFSAAAAESRGSDKHEKSECYGPSGHRSANQVESSTGAAAAASRSSSLSIPARTATSVATGAASTSAGGLDEIFMIEEGYGLSTSPSTVKQEFDAPYKLQVGSGSSAAAGASSNAGVSASDARGRKTCRITRRQLFVKYGTHRSPCTTC